MHYKSAGEWTPLVALILLAGLKSLPTDVLETAEADGATAAKRFPVDHLPHVVAGDFSRPRSPKHGCIQGFRYYIRDDLIMRDVSLTNV